MKHTSMFLAVLLFLSSCTEPEVIVVAPTKATLHKIKYQKKIFKKLEIKYDVVKI